MRELAQPQPEGSTEGPADPGEQAVEVTAEWEPNKMQGVAFSCAYPSLPVPF